MDNPEWDEEWDEQERKEQAEALLELLRLGEESRAAGKTMTAEEFMAKLRSRHKWERDLQRQSDSPSHSA